MTDSRAVIVARQPGTARAFIPVVRHLRSVGVQPVVFAYPLAARAFGPEVKFQQVENFVDAVPDLAQLSPTVVLTGTSLDVADDAAWWAHASERGARSVAFVDAWVNYWQRFVLDGSHQPRIDVLPDVVAAVDELARTRLEAFGVPASRIVVAGNPSLDLLLLNDDDSPRRARAAIGVASDELLVLLASEPEPLSAVPEAVTAVAWAPQVAAAVEIVVQALADDSRRAVVAIKLHPRELPAIDRHPPAGAAGVRVVIVRHDVPALLHASDVVVGVASTVLYEASMLGIPTLSIGTDGCGAPDVASLPGIVWAASSTGVGAFMEAATTRTSTPPAFAGGAAQRFVSALGILA